MSDPRRNFYFSASTQYSNAGDALINRELLRLLRGYGSLEVASAGAPDSFLEEILVQPEEVVCHSKLRLMAKLILRAASSWRSSRQYLVLTPGDPPGGIASGDLVRAVLFPLLWLLRVRIIKVGASVSRMDDRRLRLESWLSRFMHFYGIRDDGSVGRADRFGFSNHEYCPDLAFNLHMKEGGAGGRSTLISLREDNLNPTEVEQLHGRVRDLVFELADGSADADIGFISQVTRDDEPMKRLSHAWRGSEEYAFAINSISGLESAYSGARLVISNRLHVILLAASCGAMPVCVPTGNKNRKITDLLSSVGLGSLIATGSSLGTSPEVCRNQLANVFSRQRQYLHEVLSRRLEDC